MEVSAVTPLQHGANTGALNSREIAVLVADLASTQPPKVHNLRTRTASVPQLALTRTQVPASTSKSYAVRTEQAAQAVPPPVSDWFQTHKTLLVRYQQVSSTSTLSHLDSPLSSFNFFQLQRWVSSSFDYRNSLAMDHSQHMHSMEGHGGHGGGDMDDMCSMSVRMPILSYSPFYSRSTGICSQH